jgi:hypothetical protein
MDASSIYNLWAIMDEPPIYDILGIIDGIHNILEIIDGKGTHRLYPRNYGWEGQGAIYNQRENMDEAPINNIPGIMDGKARVRSKIKKNIWMRHPSIISWELWMGRVGRDLKSKGKYG